METPRQESECACTSQSIGAVKGALEHYKVLVSSLSGYNWFWDIDNDSLKGSNLFFYYNVNFTAEYYNTVSPI